MGNSHACADMYTWNPCVQLSALLKRNKKAVAYDKHLVNNPRGMFLPTPMLLKCGIDFQLWFLIGDSNAWPDNFAWNPHAWLSRY